MLEEKSKYYPFRYLHHSVYTVALYGQNNPVICKGLMVLRTYYYDEQKTKIDYEHTSEYYTDELFYETDKILREANHQPYGGKRILKEVAMSELGDEYRLIYNNADNEDNTYDEHIPLLHFKAPEATGTAVILKRDAEKGIIYLTEDEAKYVQKVLKELMSV
jgi:hypothetical protein